MEIPFKKKRLGRNKDRQAQRISWLKEFAYSDEEIEQIMNGDGYKVQTLFQKLFQEEMLAA